MTEKDSSLGIVVIGSVFVDIKGFPFSNFIPGSGRNAGRVETVHGGVCRNIVEDIGKVGLHPTFVGLVDETGTGADVVNHLNARGVNTEYVRAVPDGMGTWLAIFDNQGEVAASISKRPNLHGLYDILTEHGDEIFSRARAVALELDLESEVVELVFELARKHQRPVFAVVSNMSIALEHRNYVRSLHCFVCNQQEAGLYFAEDYDNKTPEQLQEILREDVAGAGIERMVVTLGANGAVFAARNGEAGHCKARKVDVKDTTGAGDAFFAGMTIGLSYGKTMQQSCEIGTRLAAGVVATTESVSPSFRPAEFELEV